MTHDPHNLKRDRRLRRRLLDSLHNARIGPLGGMYGRRLIEIIDSTMPPAQGFEGDLHAEGLLQDLIAKGMVSKSDNRRRTSQSYGLDYLLYKITASGTSNVLQTDETDPDIEDDRNLERD